jgi:DNA-binding MarR family transcriptional regulator
MNSQKLKQIANADIKDSSKIMYIKLALLGDTKVSYSNKQLVDVIGMTILTIKKALTELEDAGLITRQTHYSSTNKSIIGRTINLK